MSSYANAIQAQTTTTENGMEAYQSTMNYCVDLFGKIAASRGQDIVPLFIKAYEQNREIALKVAQWARDVRGGAGERQAYKNILKYLESKNISDAKLLASNTPEIGRYDDILVFETQEMKDFVFEMFKVALQNDDLIAAKWAPAESKSNRKLAKEFIKYLGVSPKFYRKMLVRLKKQLVEVNMCSKQFDNIEYSHVPSVAMSRYKTCFYKNDHDRFEKYIESVVKGDAKINASVVFPHDVIRNVWNSNFKFDEATKAQWNALPNYVGDASILPVVDVSGSMSNVTLSGSLNALHVAVSLGLYLSDKNKGAFKDCFVSFSGEPKIELLKGDISDKVRQLNDSDWSMNTNIEKTFEEILKVAVNGKVAQQDMPKYILILSDMQFDSCVDGYSNNAMDMIKQQYQQAGYEVPIIIFWNLNSYDNVPVRFDERGTALVSGFSPAILKSILGCKLEDITPEKIMLTAIDNKRYVC